MIKDIKYNGYTTVPSDYECPDGDLEGVVNLIPEDGSLHGVQAPRELKKFGAKEKVLFIHKTSVFTHYIVYDGSNLYWMDSTEEPSAKEVIESRPNVRSINAVGNMLMALCDDGVYYYMWKTDRYASLGNHLPNIEVSFGLKGKPRFASISGSEANQKDRYIGLKFEDYNQISKTPTREWTEDEQADNTARIMAKVNKFVREQSVDIGRFVFPFFVRYALRLYDGSLVCHSAPIYMQPCTGVAPVIFNYNYNGEVIPGFAPNKGAPQEIMLVSSALTYQLVADPDGDYNLIGKGGAWEDIVKSIDVFISKPIYPYDQNGTVKKFVSVSDVPNKFIGAIDPKNSLSIGSVRQSHLDDYDKGCAVSEDNLIGPVHYKDGNIERIIGESGNPASLMGVYSEWDYNDLYKLYRATTSGRSIPPYCVQLPEKTSDDTGDTFNFYKLCSLEISKLSTSQRNEIEVGKEYLQSLVNREAMTDDYLSHDRIIASFAYGYNSRINLSGLKRKLFRGFLPETMLAYNQSTFALSEKTSSSASQSSTLTLSISSSGAPLSVTTYIEEGGNTFSVTANGVLSMASYTNRTTPWGCYVYYPNVNATKMVLTDGNGKFMLSLEKHEFLNGAYMYRQGAWLRSSSANPSVPSVTDTSDIVYIQNKIYTSEVNNPLYFPLGGINTVGTGDVIGMASATKALSQGQFGQFPMYAFTTDGVWAMELSNTGLYNAVQPVTRDVCISAESITQTDSAVLFATDRGIMMLEGSNSVCISDGIYNKKGKPASSLDQMSKILTAAGVTEAQADIAAFRQFVDGCRMIYDYTNQRIVLFNPEKEYAYVYSLKDKAWGLMGSNFAEPVNAYPDAYAMSKDGSLLNVGDTSVLTAVKGVFWTRPFKLDYPDSLKTIDTIIQRGVFRKGHVQQALYGSRNLFDWILVGSSGDEYMRGFRGTPYKYFKVCIVCNLEVDESIYGCTVQYTPRYQNQPR